MEDKIIIRGAREHPRTMASRKTNYVLLSHGTLGEGQAINEV